MNHDRCIFCRKTRAKDKDLRFYRFPKEEVRCKEWVLACKLEKLVDLPSSKMYKKYRLCSEHFRDDDFSLNKRRLQPTACPTKFDFSVRIDNAGDNLSFSQLKEDLRMKLENQRETSISSNTPSSSAKDTDDSSKSFAFKHFESIENEDPSGPIVVSVYEVKDDTPNTISVDESKSPDDSSRDNSSLHNISQVPTTSDSEESQNIPAQKRKREDDDNEFEDQTEDVNSTNDSTTDPYFIYGQHIANELRKYDPQTLSYVKKAFADIIFEADTGALVDRYHPNSSASFPALNTDTDDSKDKNL